MQTPHKQHIKSGLNSGYWIWEAAALTTVRPCHPCSYSLSLLKLRHELSRRRDDKVQSSHLDTICPCCALLPIPVTSIMNEIPHSSHCDHPNQCRPLAIGTQTLASESNGVHTDYSALIRSEALINKCKIIIFWGQILVSSDDVS